MTPAKDESAEEKAGKRNDKAQEKPDGTKPRQLSRQELEDLRRRLQKRFHR